MEISDKVPANPRNNETVEDLGKEGILFLKKKADEEKEVCCFVFVK